ncbi:MAG: TrkH family potassium uptake protein [Paracoccus sp. (in: a-proteobacteria)]|jgi:trk system potassium uptake protein TrkH|uniref:TrkH family potassium uptake protein n=1 Tax=Paracoccus sp. TaxID=267 RepID=UPI000C412A8D|nr:potassium transporter TrkH [Paracoccus sp. (in: a-proteobacteria)]|tara:strand:- start:1614 stop:3065 length:1452 start_codon:yes stop_codon:yes gene_type:complete
MIDLRPVAHPIGKILIVLGAGMTLPMALDWWDGNPNWTIFLQCSLLTMVAGLLTMVATGGEERSLTIQQAFLVTSGLWAVLPIFGALPFILGQPEASLTDAYFEAMSGVTTTGTTAFPALDDLPRGVHLWRGILHWSGGLGIVVVAMVFLPVMKIGGMQFFRSEGFDTLGKILPRAGQIAAEMTRLYLFLTAACIVTYLLLGMTGFDAVMHAFSTVSTGGFSNYDASFGRYLGAPEWAASVFMILASIPFIRMVQAMRGNFVPLWRDVQIRAYLRWIFYACAIIVVYRLLYVQQDARPAEVIRETVFNTISTFSGTGFSSTDITQWGHLPFAILIVCGLIGGCTGSTGCSVKVFRYLVLFEAVRVQVRRMHSPHRIYALRYEGRPLDKDVVDSVMAFFTLFMLSFGLLIVGLSLTGLHPKTALTAAWTAIANVGPAWGPEVSENGSIADFPLAAKWMMIFGMFLGRLELISVLVLFLPRFWQR